jgi:hypothetical protein
MDVSFPKDQSVRASVSVNESAPISFDMLRFVRQRTSARLYSGNHPHLQIMLEIHAFRGIAATGSLPFAHLRRTT